MTRVFDSRSLIQKKASPRKRVWAFARENASWSLHSRKLVGNPSRAEKIGFTAYSHARRVPDVISPACQYGWRREDPKHVLMFCPNCALNRRESFEAAGTDRYQEVLSTGKGLRVVARWVMSEELLAQFSLAKEQYRV